ncbi:MAG: hypothetical protein RLO05_07720 [Rhodospirillales bacterium]
MAQQKSPLATLAALATIIAATIAFIQFTSAKQDRKPASANVKADGDLANSQKSTAFSVAGPGGHATATSNVNNTNIVNQIDNRVSAESVSVVIIQRGK